MKLMHVLRNLRSHYLWQLIRSHHYRLANQAMKQLNHPQIQVKMKALKEGSYVCRHAVIFVIGFITVCCSVVVRTNNLIIRELEETLHNLTFMNGYFVPTEFAVM